MTAVMRARLLVPTAAPGSFEKTRNSFRSVIRFFSADERRLRSRERDVGLCWHEQASGHTYRAAWAEETGELYAVQNGPPEDGGGHVQLLGIARDEDELERALPGWRTRCGTPGSFEWLKRTAYSALAPPAAA